VLPPQGYFVMRFVADNPGVWIFHCHIDWHLSSGLAMILIEAPQQMQERMTIPQEHIDVCQAAGIASKGNAAADTLDFLDLKGQASQPGWLPDGFTARGIVALVFSILSAICGIISIVIYGLADVKTKEVDEVSTEREQSGVVVVEENVENPPKS
jgi:iron transport multicopper oxidase